MIGCSAIIKVELTLIRDAQATRAPADRSVSPRPPWPAVGRDGLIEAMRGSIIDERQRFPTTTRT